MRHFAVFTLALSLSLLCSAVALEPPTTPAWGNAEAFTVQSLEAQQSEGFLEAWRVTLGASPDQGEVVPNGLVLEIYWVSRAAGRTTTLPGAALSLLGGRQWQVAVRLSAAGAWLYRVDENGAFLAPIQVFPTFEGGSILIPVGAAVPRDGVSAAMTGVYDPFSGDGWRRFTRNPSPWAFSADPAWSPVVDMYPRNEAVLQRAREDGVWQVESTPFAAFPSGRLMAYLWLVLGAVVSGWGLWVRYRGPHHASEVALIGDEDVTLAAEQPNA
jgi:hypothetical protein